MNNTETYERIERYLEGQMDVGEKEAFEAALLSDTHLAQELEDIRRLRQQLSRHREHVLLKEQLEEFHHEMKERSVWADFRSYIKPLAWAASLVLAGSLAFFFYSHRGGIQKEHYIELKREINQLKSSQKKMATSIQSAPVEKAIMPSRFGGTAFAIHRKGYLVTTYHVVQGADSVLVENERFGRQRAEVMQIDPALDLAILRLAEGKSFLALPYGFPSSPKLMGDKIFTLGYPREEAVYGEGYIGSNSGYEGDSSSYQIALPLNPGNSGGPLFDQKGNVVGIISGKDTKAEGAGFALKTVFLKKVLKSFPSQEKAINLSSFGSIGSLGRTHQIHQVESFVFKVIVY